MKIIFFPSNYIPIYIGKVDSDWYGNKVICKPSGLILGRAVTISATILVKSFFYNDFGEFLFIYGVITFIRRVMTKMTKWSHINYHD